MAHADRDMRQEIELFADGEEISMLPFVKEIVGNAITGMTDALKGCEDAEEIVIKIKKNK